jgi:hypothetical protein
VLVNKRRRHHALSDQPMASNKVAARDCHQIRQTNAAISLISTVKMFILHDTVVAIARQVIHYPTERQRQISSTALLPQSAKN